MLNLAARIAATRAEGPGLRAALWVQGCRKRCPGCCNPELLPLRPAQLLPVEEVWAWVEDARSRHGIEGITLLGGEPVLQARGLSRLAARCQASDIGVMLFTGYTEAELGRSELPGLPELLAATDLVVAGPFLADRPERVRAWAGSTNQTFVHRTKRYPRDCELDPAYAPSIEVRIDDAGLLRLNGWPDAEAERALRACDTLQRP